jgi:hypothetical protein
LRQRLDGMTHERLHAFMRPDRTVEHAVEHVLDLPGEFAQQACADQAARALQRVERTTDGHQRVAALGVGQPVTQAGAEIGDFLIGFFEEDLANLVVDPVHGDLEAGELGHAVAAYVLLDFFLDLDPVFLASGRDRRGHGVDVAGRVGDLFVGGWLVHEIEAVGEAGYRLARVDAGRRHGDMLDRGCLDAFERILAERLVALAVRRHRPVTEFGQALLGDVEDVFQAAAMFACGFEVVLERGQRIGQAIHLRTVRHTAVAKQLTMDEQADAVGQLGRTGRTEHAHRTADLGHQFGRASELLVVPR